MVTVFSHSLFCGGGLVLWIECRHMLSLSSATELIRRPYFILIDIGVWSAGTFNTLLEHFDLMKVTYRSEEDYSKVKSEFLGTLLQHQCFLS